MTIRILTICTGNVCRSPLAAGLLAARLDPACFEVSSAGTSALVGDQMPAPAQRIAARMGSQGSTNHRAVALTEEALSNAHLILGMERDHRRRAALIQPTVVRRTFTLLEFSHIASNIDDEQLAALVSGHETRQLAALGAVMRMRGVVPRLSSPRLYDVADPYGRSKQAYERSSKQVEAAVQQIVAFFRRVTTAPYGE